MAALFFSWHPGIDRVLACFECVIVYFRPIDTLKMISLTFLASFFRGPLCGALALLLWLLPFAACSPGAALEKPGTIYAVKKVVDGDTFWVDNGTRKGMKVRLIGVDAPETRRTGKKKKGYYGKEAKDYVTQKLQNGPVRLVTDVDSLDRYGRTLAYAYLPDGTFLNADLVKNGYAVVMTVPPNVRHADLFIKLQRKARKQQKGLWQKQPF